MFRSLPLRTALILALSWFIWVLFGTWDTDAPTARMVEGMLAALCLFLILGLAAPTRALWALRIAAGLIALGYIAYFLAEVAALLHGEHQAFRLGQPSALMAGFGLVAFAVPCLIFAVSGFPGERWTSFGSFFRRDTDPEDHDPEQPGT